METLAKAVMAKCLTKACVKPVVAWFYENYVRTRTPEQRELYTKSERARRNTEEGRARQRAMRKQQRRNPHYRVVDALRNRVWKTINTHGGTKQLSCSKELLGCDRDTLMQHLQSQFRPGMAWNNYGPVWEIDHIRPCASFNLLDEDEQRRCFHYTNLQPLFAEENRAKADRVAYAARV